EQAGEALRQELTALRDDWAESRRKEIENLRDARARCAAVRRHYGKLWRTCQKEKASLAREQRALATKMLALERWRQHVLPRTDNSPAAEKQLERLARREQVLRAAAEAELSKQEKALGTESTRLEQHANRLDQTEAALTAREEELARRVADFEQRQ